MTLQNNITVPILLNSTHYVAGTKSTYRYRFPSGGITLHHGDTISLTQISMYNSIFNISQEFNNNKFIMVYGDTEYTITLPDGLLEIDEINSLFQHWAIGQNLYLTDDKGNNHFYFNISVNPSRYKVQIDCLVIPSQLPTGWTNPTTPETNNILHSANTTPRLGFIENTNFNRILGFDIGVYPSVSQDTDFSMLGQNVPQVKPVQALLVKCNLLSNMKFSNPTDLLAIFTIPNNTKVGQVVEYEPNDYSYIDIHPGKYEFIEISFVDQVFNQVDIIDRDVVTMLLLKITN